MKWPPSEKARWISTLAAFALLLALATMRRLEIAEAVIAGEIEGATAELSGDAASYYRLAMRTPLPGYSTEREPVIVADGRIALVVAGDLDAGLMEEARDEAARKRVLANHAMLRRWSIVHSLMAMGALFGCALLVAGRCGALVASLLWADNLWLSHYGVGFLREDIAAACTLGLVAALVVLFRLPPEKRRARLLLAAAAAVAGSQLALTRLEGLGTATLLVGLWAATRWASKRFVRSDAWLAPGIVAGVWLLASPYLIFNAAKTGSPLHPMRNHAQFWRNHEFAGQPGFATRAEVVANSYCGPPETPFHYVFGLHSLPEVAGRYVSGLWAGYTRYLSRLLADRAWLAWLVPLAAAGLVWRRRWEGAFAIGAGLVALLPFAFILTLDTVLPDPNLRGVEPRFALPTLPFAFLWIAGGVGAAAHWFASRREADAAKA
ncbi:MAG: hypothetical protein FD180_265 [Planctomycetota bacterium]|nr:MAG: hypothetical protein FD180_265 [Planctomycetota bacterium]